MHLDQRARTTAPGLHTDQHPLAGCAVRVLDGGAEFVVEDWWDRLAGRSWRVADGNPVALLYAMRASDIGLPDDDEVVYGLEPGGGRGLRHTSELGDTAVS